MNEEHDGRVAVRLGHELSKRLEAWMKKQSPVIGLTRSHAIRMALDQFLPKISELKK